MKAKISKIILWPKRTDKKPRIVKFEMTGVEVITGESQTGKSSLVPIVDYCLGSDKCAIPVGEIRNHTEWFGVLLRLPDSELLLARRNPGLQAQTSEMYFDHSSEVEIPDFLNDLPATNTTAAISHLNQLAELPSLSLTGGDEGGFTGRPSFRDTAAFQFQPQHIVANPYTLFFKADTFEHQEKLKNIFPLVLGALDGATLEKRRSLRILEAELKQVRDQLDERAQRSATWLEEFRCFYSQAREFGLLTDAPDWGTDWSIDKFVGYLTPIPAHLRKNPFPTIERGASRRLSRELTTLHDSEESIAKAIEDRKRKLNRVDRLRSATDGYSQALNVQGQRLQPVPWFSERLLESHSCPVCGSESDNAAMEISRLVELAKGVAATVGSIDSVNQVLDKEFATLDDELRKLEGEANSVRHQLAQIEQKSVEIRTQRQTLTNVHNFAGRLEQELKKFVEADQGGVLKKKAVDLEKRVRELRRELDQAAIYHRQDEALDQISLTIQHYAEILGVENPRRPTHIDIRNLTVAVKGSEGRQDYLWEIGSAANWMGYHVATLLALHEHFLKLAETGSSPVPQFLFIDQPSQAFFPERMNANPSVDDEAEPTSDDIERVQRIFRALSEAVERTKRRLQIIVIDHVGEAYWSGVPDVHVVERWRDNDALIPSDWKN